VGVRAKLIGVVTEGQAIYIDGLNIWDYVWQDTTEPDLVVFDPQYPKQRHSLTVYKIINNEKSIQFAAGEFSNCVWGFYKLSFNEN